MLYTKNTDLHSCMIFLHQHSAYQTKYRKIIVTGIFVDDYNTPGKSVVEVTYHGI